MRNSKVIQNYDLSARIKSFPHISNIDSFFDISESEILVSLLNNPPISLLDSSPNDCDFSLDRNLSLSSSSSLHSNDYNSGLEAYFQDDTHVVKSSIPSTIPLNTPKNIQPQVH